MTQLGGAHLSLLLLSWYLLRLRWDQEAPDEIQKKWEAWQASLRKAPSITAPRCVFKSHRTHFEIHGFADASKVAACVLRFMSSHIKT